MTDELKKKLGLIIELSYMIGVNSLDMERKDKAVKDLVPEITQAFIDAGWNKPFDDKGIINFGTEEHPVLIHKDSLPFSTSGGGYIDIPKDLRLTGQEWYDRFLDEFHKLPEEDYRDGRAYLKIAKKAAGLDTEAGNGKD